ncbi:MAG: hypothetical protein OXP66_13070 [Candidatus Tectomicrobia bacterium]|nr:hypothetical protein [Candidatus Tectomicrobia bacterium]
MPSRRTIWLLAWLVILMAAGCSQESDVGEEPGLGSVTPGGSPDPLPPMGDVVIDDLDTPLDHWGGDNCRLHTAGDAAPVIEDGTLTLTVSYSGGCARHDFTLVADDEFRESDPVELDVFLAHEGNGDRCEAYETRVYEFDLAPVRELYLDTYGTNSGAILLRFQGRDVPEDDPVVVYLLMYTFD